MQVVGRPPLRCPRLPPSWAARSNCYIIRRAQADLSACYGQRLLPTHVMRSVPALLTSAPPSAARRSTRMPAALNMLTQRAPLSIASHPKEPVPMWVLLVCICRTQSDSRVGDESRHHGNRHTQRRVEASLRHQTAVEYSHNTSRAGCSRGIQGKSASPAISIRGTPRVTVLADSHA